jgi:hypothetical protein
LPICPKYRTRLFLSVDLVGSTAFKAGSGNEPIDRSAHPRWVDEIRNFYQEFPQALHKRYYQHTSRPEYQILETIVPTVWKTIGDEIIFCCRVSSTDHLVCIVSAFTEALDDYGRTLDIRCKNLDVKGTAWLAAFPAPNVTVEVMMGPLAELPDEDIESKADKTPHEFDFLGRAIDCGFRLTRFSSSDKLTLSAELALALCESSNSNSKPFLGKFNYIGREEIKGVIDGRPYPIVTIITERSALRREVFELERGARGIIASTPPIALKNFLAKFMEDEGIEPAIFTSDGADLPVDRQPMSYMKFCEAWGPIANETQRRKKNEIASATEEPTDTRDDVPPDVESAIAGFAKTSDRPAAEPS